MEKNCVRLEFVKMDMLLKRLTVLITLFIISFPTLFARTIRIPDVDLMDYIRYQNGGLEEVSEYYDRNNAVFDIIGRYNDWTYSYVPCDMKYSYKLLDEGKLDLIYDALYSFEKIREGYYFSLYPSTIMYLDLVTLSNNDKYNMVNLEMLDGCTLGYLAGRNDHKSLIEGFCWDLGIKVNLVAYDNNPALFNALSKGEVDVILSTVDRVYPTHKVIYSFGKYPVYYTSRDKEIIDELNEALDRAFADDPTTITNLFLGSSNLESVALENFSWEERDIIKNIGPYVVVHNSVSEGTELVDSKQKYLDNLSNLTGLKFELIVNYGGFSGLKKNVITEAVYVPKSMKDRGTVIYTDVLYRLQCCMVGNPNVKVENLQYAASPENYPESKPVIAVSSDISSIVPYLRSICVPFDCVLVSDISTAVEDLSDGKYDALVLDSLYLKYKYKLNDYKALAKTSTFNFEVPIRYAVVGENNNIVAKAINAANRQLGIETYQSYLDQNAMKIYNVPSKNRWMRLLGIVFLIAIVISVIFSTIFFIFKNRKLKKAALKDFLTDINNIHGFEKATSKIMENSPWSTFVFAEINIKDFSYVNRLYGSGTGNNVLRKVARMLEEYASKRESCVVARGYADNFYVMQKLIQEPTSVMDDFSDCFTWIQDTIVKENEVRIILKCGCALSEGFTDVESTVKDLISKAGYARRFNDRNLVQNVSLFSGIIKDQKYNEEKIESRIDSALNNEEFYVVYQPKICLKNQKICGAEALVRWNSPVSGLIPPDQFIPILEHNGYASKLDFYVYNKVFEYIKSAMDEGNSIVPISLNISRLNYNPSEFVNELNTIVDKFDIPKDLIELEIEERFAGADEEVLKEMISMLQKSGYKVSMDDFGSGQSSLNMLSEIPVDIVKIDQKFLRQASENRDARIILTYTIEMLKAMGKRIVCEGVETAEQVEFLRSVDCDIVQGYYYSRPLDSFSFREYLIKHI